MEDMKKDREIEEQFLSYFDGVPQPSVDLEAVKRAGKEERAERKRAKRRGIAGFVSAAACLMVIVLLCVNFLPSLFVPHISVATVSAETISFTEVQERFEKEAGFLSPFSLADNAAADYYLYRSDGEEVMLRADVGLWRGLSRLQASVYIDLTNGKYVYDEFRDYKKFSEVSENCRYTSYQLENGEYGMSAYCAGEDALYFVDANSRDEADLSFILSLLHTISVSG